MLLKDFLSKSKLIVYLSAPGAFTLNEPEALSNNDKSPELVTTDSEIVIPTL